MQNVVEKIDTMCEGYLELMLKCLKDADFKERFKENPLPYMREYVGVTIPDTVKIVLDDHERRFAMVYVKIDDKTIAFKEMKLGIEHIEEFVTDGNRKVEKSEKFTVVEPSKVSFEVNRAIKDSEVVITIPFLDSRAEVLTEIKFDDAEIVLSSCT